MRAIVLRGGFELVHRSDDGLSGCGSGRSYWCANSKYNLTVPVAFESVCAKDTEWQALTPFMQRLS